MEVELPNGQIAEFPDDMPHEKIESALRQHFTATRQDKGQAFEMIKQRFPGMPEGLIKTLMPIAVEEAEHPVNPNNSSALGAFGRSAIRTPLEAAENFGALLGAPTLKNAPFPGLIEQREADKEHPLANIAGNLAGFAIPGAGTIKAMRSIPGWGTLAEKSAPNLLRRAPVWGTEGAAMGALYSPEGQRGEGALTGAALGMGASVLPSIGHGFSSLKNRISSLRNLDRLRERGEITEKQYQEALANEEALKALSQKQGLGTDVVEMEAQLPEMKMKSEQLAQEIKEILKVNTENMLGAPTGERLVPEAENLLRSASQKASENEAKISEHLYKGYEHGVPIAESVVNEIEGVPIAGSKKRMGGVKKEIGQLYDNIETNLKDQNIVIPNSARLKDLETQARKSLENSKLFFKNDQEYDNTVKNIVNQMDSSIKGNDIIPASDVLSNYRSMRNLSQKLRAKAYSREVAGNKDLQKEILSQAEELEGKAGDLEQVMEGHDLGTELDNLKSANTRWRDEIIPLYKNSTYQTFLNKGYSPSKDLIYNLRGSGSGQEIIRNIIKKNPILVRSILGQRYANKPGNIHEFDQLAQEFIEAAPDETRNLIKAHKESLNKVEQAKASVESAKSRAENLKKESQRVEKSFSEEKNNQEVRVKKEQEQKKLQNKIADSERNIVELKKIANQKNISLKEKIEIEQKIKEAEKFKNKLNTALISMTASAAGTGAGYKIIKSFS